MVNKVSDGVIGIEIELVLGQLPGTANVCNQL
jgi:hypothetical protein